MKLSGMMLGSRKISSLGRRELTTIQITGYSIRSASAISSVCRTTLVMGLRNGLRRRSLWPRPVTMVSVARSAVMAASSILVIVENPIPRGPEHQDGQDADDHEQQPGHRRGVAHVVVREALLIQVQRVEERGVDGAAGSSRDDVRLGEGLERADQLQHRI